MTGPLRYMIPSLADLLFVSVLLYLSFVPDRGLLNDGDTGYHIRAGEYILDTFTLPQVDPYSFITPRLPWTVHEWLSEVVMAIAHRLSGLSGVVVLYVLTLAATFYAVVRVLKAQGHNALVAAAATVVIIALSMVHWLARPHLFSFLIIVIWISILDSHEYRDRNQLYLLPPLMLLWVNLHGGFIIGFVLLGIYLTGNLCLVFTDSGAWRAGGKQRAKRYGALLGICMGTALLNPFGWKIFLFPFTLVFDRYLMDHTSEFFSPNFHEQPLFKALLLLLMLLLAYSGKRPTPIRMVLILFFTNMALCSIRYVPLFALVVVPIMVRHLNFDLAPRLPRVRAFFRRRLDTVATMDGMSRGFLWPSLAMLLVFIQLYNGTIVHGFDPKKKAVDAVAFMKREPVPGRMFNSDEIGDLIIYAAHEQYKVFIDGRLDMYGSKHIREYYKITGFSPGWEDILRRHGITWVIYDTDSELVRFLAGRQDWRLIYSDRVASIFVNNTPLYAGLIARYPLAQPAGIDDEGRSPR
ncbi:MAG: hypothetical protein WCP20_14170 [Desulfuromonadales bacterium]